MTRFSIEIAAELVDRRTIIDGIDVNAEGVEERTRPHLLRADQPPISNMTTTTTNKTLVS